MLQKSFKALPEHAPLLAGIHPAEIMPLLAGLSAKKAEYKKGEYLLHQGAFISGMGFIVTGMVQIMKEDFWGNRMILAAVETGGLFCEVYAACGIEKSPVSVLALKDTTVLYLDISRILNAPSASPPQRRLVRNLLAILAQKNLLLTQKITHMGQKTTRAKLLSYLSAQSAKAESASFLIPFDRQQLADYLGVERSAMSHELSKLQKQGVLRYQKNAFTLLDLSHSPFSDE